MSGLVEETLVRLRCDQLVAHAEIDRLFRGLAGVRVVHRHVLEAQPLRVDRFRENGRLETGALSDDLHGRRHVAEDACDTISEHAVDARTDFRVLLEKFSARGNAEVRQDAAGCLAEGVSDVEKNLQIRIFGQSRASVKSTPGVVIRLTTTGM